MVCGTSNLERRGCGELARSGGFLTRCSLSRYLLRRRHRGRRATPIAVHGGDRLEADIHLNPVPALHLIFRVSEDLNRGMILPQLEKQVFDGTEHENAGNIQSIAPGVVEMAGIAPGRYSVRMPGSNGQWKEPTEVNLESGGELDVSPGRSTSQIKLAVQIEGAATLLSQLQIILRPSNGKTDYGQMVDAKGAVDFSDVIAAPTIFWLRPQPNVIQWFASLLRLG